MASGSSIAEKPVAAASAERTLGLRLPPVRTLARVGFVLLCVGAVVGMFVYPTYPNYDSICSLIGGDELRHGHTPSFEAYRAPTQHPLWVVLGAFLSVFGRHADTILMVITVGSFVA